MRQKKAILKTKPIGHLQDRIIELNGSHTRIEHAQEHISELEEHIKGPLY